MAVAHHFIIDVSESLQEALNLIGSIDGDLNRLGEIRGSRRRGDDQEPMQTERDLNRAMRGGGIKRSVQGLARGLRAYLISTSSSSSPSSKQWLLHLRSTHVDKGV